MNKDVRLLAAEIPRLRRYARALLRDVERAIQRLSEEQKTTLLLVGLEGMRYEEVAQICDVPLGTVRSRLSRAREELRGMMEGRWAPPDAKLPQRTEVTRAKTIL